MASKSQPQNKNSKTQKLELWQVRWVSFKKSCIETQNQAALLQELESERSQGLTPIWQVKPESLEFGSQSKISGFSSGQRCIWERFDKESRMVLQEENEFLLLARQKLGKQLTINL